MAIDALAKMIFIEQTVKRSDVSHIVVALDESHVNDKVCNPIQDRNYRVTSGSYEIVFNTKAGRFAKLPFAMCGDLFAENKWRRRFGGWTDFVKQAEEDTRLKWVLENTTITKEHFETARENKLMRIPFCIDIVKYNKKMGTRDYRDLNQKALTNMIFKKKED